MKYVALTVREYGEGRICIMADRISGYVSAQGKAPSSFSRKIFEWVGQKYPGETISVGVINSANIPYSDSIRDLKPIYFVETDLQDIGIEILNKFDVLYFVGLPDMVDITIKNKIATYVQVGGGILIEVPDRGGENINVLTSIENIYCYSYSLPLFTAAYWTLNGAQHYVYNSEVRLGFLTTLESSVFSTDWTILMSDVETINTAQNQQSESGVSTIGNIGSEFGISYYSSMVNGIVTLEEAGSSSSSSSYDSSSSSSSSSLYDDTTWDICKNIHAQWDMNDNSNSPIVWNKENNLIYMGFLKRATTNIWTSSKHVVGKINGALSFNGVDNYIEIPSNTYFNFTDGITDLPFSVSFWIKPLATPINGVLIRQSDTWSVVITNGFLLFWVRDVNNNVNCQAMCNLPITSINNWYHVVMTYNGIDMNGVNIYIDGSNFGETISINPLYQTMNTISQKMYIGGDPESLPITYASFNGYIDSVIVINKELNNMEIEGLYNRGNGTEDCQGVFKYTSSSSTSSSTSASTSSTSIDSNSSSSHSSLSSPSLSSISSSSIGTSSSISLSSVSLSSVSLSSESESESLSSMDVSESSASSLSSQQFSSSSSSAQECEILRSCLPFPFSVNPCGLFIYDSVITNVTRSMSTNCVIYGMLLGAISTTGPYLGPYLTFVLSKDNSFSVFSQIGWGRGYTLPSYGSIVTAYVNPVNGSGIGGFLILKTIPVPSGIIWPLYFTLS